MNNTIQPTDAVEGPDYLTGEQVAALLQVSVKSVQRWASTDSSMPVLRIGRTVRFPRERLVRWLKTREQGAGRARQSEKLWASPLQPIDEQGKIGKNLSVCAHI